MIQQTSLLAYSEVLIGLNEKQQRVLEAIISLGDCYDQKIADHLKWTINCVTPRRLELLESGKIENIGLLKNKSNRSVMGWRAII